MPLWYSTVFYDATMAAPGKPDRTEHFTKLRALLDKDADGGWEAAWYVDLVIVEITIPHLVAVSEGKIISSPGMRPCGTRATSSLRCAISWTRASLSCRLTAVRLSLAVARSVHKPRC